MMKRSVKHNSEVNILTCTTNKNEAKVFKRVHGTSRRHCLQCKSYIRVEIAENFCHIKTSAYEMKLFRWKDWSLSFIEADYLQDFVMC